LAALKLDKILVVPAFQNPLRDAMATPTSAQRLEMIRLGLQSLPQCLDRIEVRELEINRGGPSYTIDTLRELKKSEEPSNFFLIVGADQFEIFDKWKDYKKILSSARLAVTTRPGYKLPLDKTELPLWAQKLAHSVRKDSVRLKGGGEIVFVKLQDVEASSSDVRKKLRRRENVSHLTPAVVAE